MTCHNSSKKLVQLTAEESLTDSGDPAGAEEMEHSRK